MKEVYEMAISPIHLILNDIRKSYTGKNVSLIDIRIIENEFRICSIANIRSDGTAFLRITSYGLDEVVFEDVCLDFTHIPQNLIDMHEFIYILNKSLFDLAYGVILVDVSEPLISKYESPSMQLFSLEDEITKLRTKCEELEKNVKKLSDDNVQVSLFDFNENE